MKLIIDCGSTKADWVVMDGENVVLSMQTGGFNPNYSDKDFISSIILDKSLYKSYFQDITEIFFYGTGCGKQENCNLIEDVFKIIFPHANFVVTHDIMAACHAIFGKKEGIACILGTGSNSCLYNGENIVDKAVSLGYILGDEGSANHIGRTLVRDYFYNKMPSELSVKLEKEYDLNISEFIDNVYHKSQVSKYLAMFSKFAYENINHDYIKSLCSKCFDDFIEYFILKFKPNSDIEIGFVGSIAYYFQDILSERLEDKGLKINKIIKSPIEGLIEYYSQK